MIEKKGLDVMTDNQLTANQIALLRSKEGISSKYDENAIGLIDMKLIDVEPIPLDRFKWKISAAGERAIDQLT